MFLHGRIETIFCCLLVTFLTLTLVTSQECDNNNEFGEDKPSDKKDDVDDASLTDTYFMTCQNEYVVNCCGLVDRWQWYSDDAGSVEFIIWRPTGGGFYEAVHTFTDTNTKRDDDFISPTETALVLSGDCIGWHTTGIPIVTYKKNNNGEIVQYQTIADASGSVDWNGATSTTETRGYAIGFRTRLGNSPTWTTSDTTYTLQDSTATSFTFATVMFEDVDLTDTVTIAMTPNSYFTFVDNGDFTGTVSTDATNPISDLSGTDVTLTFTATDLCGRTASGTIDITIPNQKPTLSGLPASYYLSEDNTAEMLLYTITCTDTDTLTYSIPTIEPSNAPDTEFFFVQQIPSTTDFGVYIRGMPVGSLSYNSNRDFDITIQCTDGKDPQTGIFNVILVQNQPPVIINLPPPTSVDVSALTTTNGDVVFNVDHTDVEGNTVTFSLASCTPTPCLFDVLDSGEVQATQDLEGIVTPGFDLNITIEDFRNPGISRILSIVMTEINSVPILSNLPFYIAVDENTATLTSLMTVSVTDFDTADTHTFRMTSNPVEGNSYFEIDSATGVVTTKAALNYEALGATSFPFVVTVSDGRSEVSATLTLEVLDVNEAMSWNSAQYMTDTTEGLAVGTVLTDPGFAVTDLDNGDTLSCYMDCGTYNGYFGMNTSCALTVTSVFRRDNGLPSNITCTVTGRDKGLNSDTTSLVINIADANNYSPTFTPTTYDYTLSGYAGSNAQVGTPTATDADVGAFGTITYSLDQSGLAGSWFKINTSTGEISTQNAISTCNCSGTQLVVYSIATDLGGRVSTATVIIDILETTTTTTTSTTDRYITFFEDEKNIAWFVLLILALVLILPITFYVFARHVFVGQLCKGRCCDGYSRRQEYSPRRHHVDRQFEDESVRNPPPPKEHQTWRHGPPTVSGKVTPPAPPPEVVPAPQRVPLVRRVLVPTLRFPQFPR